MSRLRIAISITVLALAVLSNLTSLSGIPIPIDSFEAPRTIEPSHYDAHRGGFNRGNNEDSSRPLFHFIFSGNWSNFSPSYARAVESVLYHHPDAVVRLHSQNSRNETVSIPLLEPLFQEFDLEIEYYDLAEELQILKNYLNETLVQEFIDDLPQWMYTTKKRENNKSNIYRLLLLLTRGGVYMDVDCIYLKPLDALGPNVVGKESKGHVNTAIIKAEKGSIYMEKALTRLFIDFRPTIWAYNGPRLLTRTLKYDFPECEWFVGEEYGTRTNGSDACPATILGVDGFYPLRWDKTDSLCAELPINDTRVMERKAIIDRETYAIHLTGKKKRLPSPPDTLCRLLKNRFCVTNTTCAMVA
eukprot:scaffold4809_cov116-Cylindrotheca_fusiformis.AAC.11